MPFTPEELEEMRRADEEIDALPDFVDPWSDEIERMARYEDKDHREKAIADYQRRYYEDEDHRAHYNAYMREYMREYKRGIRRKEAKNKCVNL